MSTIEQYLGELRRELGAWPKRRALAEVEAHLRESAEAVGEEEAVRRFGSARMLALELKRPNASRLAAFAVLALLLSYPALYPVPENALPPAPWPGDVPSKLAWKQDAVLALLLVAAGAAAVGAARFRAGNGTLLVAAAVSLACAGAAAVLGVVLSFEWAAAVPGTPLWLPYVGFTQIALSVGAAALVARAARLSRT